MDKVGIVLVSHSQALVKGLVDVIKEVAKDVPLTYVGGTEKGEIGTSFPQVEEAVQSNPGSTLLAFFDLGSARLNLEMVAELSAKTVLVQTVSFVEGAYTAAALLQAGTPLTDLLAQLEELTIHK